MDGNMDSTVCLKWTASVGPCRVEQERVARELQGLQEPE